MTTNKVLYIFVDKILFTHLLNDFNYNKFTDFLNKTNENVKNHNNRLEKSFPDSGFDLLCPNTMFLNAGSFSNKVGLGVRAAMYEVDENGCRKKPLGYYLYPRSSTGSKTSLRLSNSVGIIDSGYRGELIGVFDATNEETIIGRDTRLLQICSGDLTPFNVKLVYSINDLHITTRGSSGFGSTGNGVRDIGQISRTVSSSEFFGS